jgi:cytochrome d ubiquinol oxidase subunit II
LRQKLFETGWFMRALQWIAPLGFAAVLAGWTTTEVGRQPWTVYGLLRTADSTSPSLTGGDVLGSLLLYVAVYLLMYPAGIAFMLGIVRGGVGGGAEPAGPVAGLHMMNSIAPVWDGNETWLILGGVGLLAAFPLAFAIIIPAVYFPVLAMLLGLVFRGVAFEFQFKQPRWRRFWSLGFCVGSSLAAFSQGTVLGALVQGLDVSDRSFGGGSFDWLSPFSAMTGVALMFGYALLGACWLVIKGEGELEGWARAKGKICYCGVLLGIAAVSV